MESRNRLLIFRLGGVGFVLSLGSVVEVIDQIVERLDFERSDSDHGIVAALHFRHTLIPVVDPTLRLGIVSPVLHADRKIIVLQGTEGNWALLADSIDELAVVQDLKDCLLPSWLSHKVKGLYSQVKLSGSEPLIVFEAEHFYGMNVKPL